MTKDPYFVQSGEELAVIAHHFLEKGIHTAPVITPTGEILGMLTELSLIKAKIRQHLEPEAHEKVIHHKELLIEALFVQDTDPITVVIQQVMKAATNRIIVIDKLKRMVGVISPKDLLAYLIGESRKSKDLRAALNQAKEELEGLKEQLEETMKSLDKYKDIFQDSPTMMHSVNKDGRIIMANAQFHQALGYQPGELLGKTLYDLYAKSVQHEAMQGLQQIIEKGFHQNTYSTMMTKDGGKLRVDVASSALYDDNGAFIGSISVTRTIDSDTLLRALHGAFKSTGEGDLD